MNKLTRILMSLSCILIPISGATQNFTEQDLLKLAKSGVASYVKVMAAAMQQQAPLETGTGKMINALAIGKTLGFVTEIRKSQRARTKKEQVNYVCSASYLRAIIDNGGVYSVQYVSPSRIVLGYVEVSPGDCK